MPHAQNREAETGYSALVIDSDTRFLKHACEIVAGAGHRAWGAGDLIAAINFLADQTPDVLLLELALLDSDGADPLGDLRELAPAVPVVLTADGPPDGRVRMLRQSHPIYGYHDKAHGTEGLRLWLEAALNTQRQVDINRRTRQGLRTVLEAVPQINRIQSLDDVLEGILWQIEGVVEGASSFLAARNGAASVGWESDPNRAALYEDELIVRAATGRFTPGLSISEIPSVDGERVRRAVDERRFIVDESSCILPLSLGDEVLGIVFLDRPPADGRDIELLQIFAAQAAAAIQRAILYELATVDWATRAFLRPFAIRQLAAILKLGRRKAFPVAVGLVRVTGLDRLRAEAGEDPAARALRYVGRVLKATIRDSDVLGLYDDGRFLVVLPDADVVGARCAMTRVQNALNRPREPRPEGLPAALGVEVGLAAAVPGATGLKGFGPSDIGPVLDGLLSEAEGALAGSGADEPVVLGRDLTWSELEG